MAKWESKNLEIRSKSVEQTLVPLVTQVIISRRFVTHDDGDSVFNGKLSILFVNEKNYLCLIGALDFPDFTIRKLLWLSSSSCY